jgi:predicted aspartyl protease
MMEAVRTFETSVDNHFTRQYIPEDNSEHHTRRRENVKSHKDEQGHFSRKDTTSEN